MFSRPLFRSSSSFTFLSRTFSSAVYPHHSLSPNLPHGLSQFNDFVSSHAKGSWIFGTNGKKYLDFSSGIGVTNLGHCHPVVNAAAHAQMDRGIHLQLNCAPHDAVVNLVKRFKPHLPKSMADNYQVLFSNSGSEAIENAVKLARMVTGRQTVIVFQGGFHGRTIAAGALTTAKYVYRAGFQPTMAGVHVAPFPYCTRCPCSSLSQGGLGLSKCCNDPIHQLKLLLKQQTSPDEVAAILVEPVLGEGGYVVPPQNFLSQVQDIARSIGALFLADEVQTGFGRTGTMFAYQQFNCEPDILIMAKGIANGFPLSAIATHAKHMSKAKMGSVGGTYGGNAVSCAASSAVFDIFEKENILDNVKVRGEEFRAGLHNIVRKYPGVVRDIRGLGLMNAMEFHDEDVTGVKGAASQMVKECLKNEMLILSAGCNESLRFIPPLTMSKEELQTGLERIDKSVKAVFRK
jgi:4-aminobutyrate aminotransferase